MLVNAGTAYKKDTSLLTLKGAVVEALAYVEIGLERQEAFALQAYSTAIQELEKQTGVKVSQLLTETDEQGIALLRQGMVEQIDTYRYEKGMSGFMDIDKDPIAQALFNRDLANFRLTNKRFNQERTDFRFLNEKYKLDNDCVTRWLALNGL